MKSILALLAALTIAGAVFSAEPVFQNLDPAKPEDRAALLEIVKRSVGGTGNQAAKMLAGAGYRDELLQILRTTTRYNTMQAVAQTRDENTIPIFEARLRANPNDRYLVGALAYVQSPKASPILVGLLGMHPDAKRPSSQDMVGCILNAIVFNRCQDAIPVLRERFAACGTSSQANRKSNYALTLLSLGDPIGTDWLRRKLRADIESNVVHSWTADRLATLCEWMPPRSDIVRLQDASIMTPLLSDLVRGASSEECPFARECCRALRVLTRHDFPLGDPAWQEWYAAHAHKHPIYTTQLDRAAKLCVDTFRRELAQAGKTNDRLKWIDHFLGQPRNGFGAHNSFLWKLESHPEQHALALLPDRPTSPDERKKLGLLFTVALTSRWDEPDPVIFRKDFHSINVTVCLSSLVGDEGAKRRLVEIADRASGILSDYETFYQKAKGGE